MIRFAHAEVEEQGCADDYGDGYAEVDADFAGALASFR
jgi:hypothetical protein